MTVPEIEAGSASIAIKAELKNASGAGRSCSLRQELYGPDATLAATQETPVSMLAGGYQTVAHCQHV